MVLHRPVEPAGLIGMWPNHESLFPLSASSPAIVQSVAGVYSQRLVTHLPLRPPWRRFLCQQTFKTFSVPEFSLGHRSKPREAVNAQYPPKALPGVAVRQNPRCPESLVGNPSIPLTAKTWKCKCGATVRVVLPKDRNFSPMLASHERGGTHRPKHAPRQSSR